MCLVSVICWMACGGGSDKSAEDPIKAGNDSPENACSITEMKFSLGQQQRSIKIIYDGSRVKQISLNIDGKPSEQQVAFGYDTDGRLKTVKDLLNKSGMKYHYDGQGRLLSIEGEGNLSNRTFEYNEQGQIIKQSTVMNGKPFAVQEFEYDEAGQPVVSKIFDTQGALSHTTTFEYDDKYNPFVGLGAFMNSMELMLGYPIGNYGHNITRMTTTYSQKSKWKIDGSYKNPGEQVEKSLFYEYNAEGYPVKVTRNKGGDRENQTTMTYNCS